jgi:hypothetical protein
MRSELVFNWRSKAGDSIEVIFTGLGKLIPEVVGAYIKSAIQKGLFADAILVLCPSSMLTDATQMLSDRSLAPQRELKRVSSKTGLLIAGYDATGKILKATFVGKKVPSKVLQTIEFDDLVKCGVESVFQNGRGLIKAPAGYGFSKLSGGGSTHFIRAEDVLDDVGVVDFLAFNALRSIPDPKKLEHIFIDSMAISGIAYSLREVLNRNFSICCVINSFHSYSDLRSVPKQDLNRSFCIISASSSMALYRDWVNQTGCSNEDVLTLLSFDDVKSDGLILYRFPKPIDWQGDLHESSSTKLIRVLGERFSPESIKPKVVELNIRHADLKLRAFQGSDLLLSNITRALRQKSNKTNVIHFDFESLVTNNRFGKWLDRHLRVSIPASIQGIIYQDDADSKLFADKCAEYLESTLKLKLSAGVQVFKDDSDLSVLDKDRALLIVASVIGKGNSLLSLSRELRNHHHGAKVYLAGIQLDHSLAAAQFLVKNLTKVSDNSSQFHVFETFATGTALRDSFNAEIELLQKISVFKVMQPERARLLAGTGTGIDTEALLPRLKTKLTSKPLDLREDFVFWERGYSAGPAHAPAVLLTIGSVLQRAREDEKNPENGLFSKVLQQVVLHPNMFARFNDGIIQASLLRQANDSELDYSLIEEFSLYMRNVLIDQLLKRYRMQGEAVLEFALALKIGRLKISPSDHRSLHVRAKEILCTANNCFEALLLEFLDPSSTSRKSVNDSHF